MREHKFKLWDKKNKCWIDIYKMALKEEAYKDLMYCDMEGFGVMEDGSLIIADECGQYRYLDSKRFELVEFTGLKDKNGIEVYEGDLIKATLPEWEGRYNSFEDDERVDNFPARIIIGEVQIRVKRGAGMVWRKDVDIDGEADINLKNHWFKIRTKIDEVIGNIWENPELLEVNK